MRALITGVTGFVGGHLAEFLSTQKEVEVHGIGRNREKAVRLKKILPGITFHAIDLSDFNLTKAIIGKVKPDRIYHLAAFSSVAESLASPAKTLLNNIRCETNVLEAVRQLDLRPRIHIAGSSEEYGAVKRAGRLRETDPLRPSNSYGISKVIQGALAEQYGRSHGIPVLRTRAFMHTGPGQDSRFAMSSFARQIALIEAGRNEPLLHTGNLNLTRDYSDVRDIVRAYWLALEKGAPGEVYNVCSGRGFNLKKAIQIYRKKARKKIRVLRDPALVRSGEPARIVGDPSKFMKKTGWVPQIPMEKTLSDLLNYWRKEVAA